MMITIRTTSNKDIPAMQLVRNSVKENRLSHPSVVPDSAYIDYLTERGKGWVCEVDQVICGFAIVDLQTNSVWALFVDPRYEGKGIGKQLHNEMLNWYFSKTQTTIWLSTDANTKAALFYRKQGWTACGYLANGELKFEMPYQKDK